MGDSGSYLFGSVATAAALQGPLDPSAMFLTLAPFSIYFFDTGFTIVRRFAKRESLTSPHKGHLYQRLQRAMNGRHVPPALLVASLSAVCGVAVISLPYAGSVPVIFSSCAAYWVLCWSLERRASLRVAGSR
jgi:UDP-N-acetylmuramyl pentapeptide phosphotransferase/UDP-N-acetylglucosamine-1-phosphate transferase